MQGVLTFVSNFYQLLPPMLFIATLFSFIYEEGIYFFAPGVPISRQCRVLIIDYSTFYFIWKCYFCFTLVGHVQNEIDSSGCLLGYRNMHQKLSVIHKVQISRYDNISCYT